MITRHEKAVAALVSPEDAKQVRRLRAAGPQEGLAGLIGKYPPSDDLEDFVNTVRDIRERKRQLAAEERRRVRREMGLPDEREA